MTATSYVGGQLAVSRSRIGTAFLGYDRVQVLRHLRDVETERQQLVADRDAATVRAEKMVRLLEQERSVSRELQARLDRVCRSPIEPDGLQERLWRMVVLANDEAAEIIAGAQTAANACIDDRAEAENDFARAMADRRARADQRRAEQDAAARARAELLVRDARERAEQLLTEAGAQLQLMQDLRSRLSDEIREANQVLRNAVAALAEPCATSSDETQPA